MANIRAGVASSNPSFLTSSGTSLFFAANNGTNGTELWSLGNASSGRRAPRSDVPLRKISDEDGGTVDRPTGQLVSEEAFPNSASETGLGGEEIEIGWYLTPLSVPVVDDGANEQRTTKSPTILNGLSLSLRHTPNNSAGLSAGVTTVESRLGEAKWREDRTFESRLSKRLRYAQELLYNNRAFAEFDPSNDPRHVDENATSP